MVWSEYVRQAYETGLVSPTSPKSPKFTPRKVDPRRKIDTDDAVDLYFYMKDIVESLACSNILLDKPGYNSFTLEELCNTRQVDIELDWFYQHWDDEYHYELDIMRDRLNRSLQYMGKKINITKKMFRTFVYKNSSMYLRYC